MSDPKIGFYTLREKKSREKRGRSLLEKTADFTALDLETTGLSPEFDSIIEMAAVKYRDGKPTERFEQLVNPGYEIDEFIVSLTGITNAMLSGQPMIEKALPEFISFIGDDIVVGHNISFDINFLYDDCECYLGKPFTNDFVDTMRIARRLHKDWSNHKLDTMIRELGIGSRDQHRALNDAELTAESYLKMILDPAYDKINAPYSWEHAKEIVAQDGYADEDNPLFGKVCVFTGVLERMTRQEAMQLVVNIGGLCGDRVTRETNFLILGNNDYCKSIRDGKSSKQKKAELYRAEGQDITIIPESVFYDILADSTRRKSLVDQVSLFQEAGPDLFETVKSKALAVVERNWLDPKLLSCDKKATGFTIKFNGSIAVQAGTGKKPFIQFPSKGAGRSIESSKNGKARISLEKVEDILAYCEQIEETLQAIIDSSPIDFSCCSRYEQCSDMLQCIHPDLKMRMLCSYRRTLSSGKVFYGKNRNVE